MIGLSLRFFSPLRVFLTDISQVVPLLQANIILNHHLNHITYFEHSTSTSSTTSPSVKYEALTHFWGTSLDPLLTTPLPNELKPPIIIASDVVYDPAGFQPLLTSIQLLLGVKNVLEIDSDNSKIENSNISSNYYHAEKVIMSHRHRNPEDYNFFDMVKNPRNGLKLQEINLDHIFQKQINSKDHSLLDVQIFEITKLDS